jgi:broad specificity phosphatase PhoE
MKILFIRHGESQSNVNQVQASASDHLNGITKNGETQIKNVAKNVVNKIDAVYASPYNRTVASAEIFIKNRPENLQLKIDDRLREINYGAFTDDRDNPEMARIAEQQIAGDYEIKFSGSGENKREIVSRFMGFLLRLIDECKATDTVVVFSHGRAISILEYEFTNITKSKSHHVHTDNGSINQLILRKKHQKIISDFLVNLNKLEIKNRLAIVDKYIDTSGNNSITSLYKSELRQIAVKNFDDIDLSCEVLSQFCNGLFSQKVFLEYQNINRRSLSTNDVILLVILQNATNFIKHFINHYQKIGIKYFVFIDNNSSDGSRKVIRDHSTDDIVIDIWQTNEKFDAIKAMGWKQQMMVYYGLDRWYLNLDIDELLVFDNYKKRSIANVIKTAESRKSQSLGGIMIDMYPNAPLNKTQKIPHDNILDKYCYCDKNTYTRINNQKYLARIFGGPRCRLFNVSPSLQKFPLIYATKQTLGINPHFWYPYKINLLSNFQLGILHYKFLPDDLKKYVAYTISGVHYNNSKEYKAYITTITKHPSLNFFDKDYSVKFTDFYVIKKILLDL